MPSKKPTCSTVGTSYHTAWNGGTVVPHLIILLCSCCPSSVWAVLTIRSEAIRLFLEHYKGHQLRVSQETTLEIHQQVRSDTSIDSQCAGVFIRDSSMFIVWSSQSKDLLAKAAQLEAVLVSRIWDNEFENLGNGRKWLTTKSVKTDAHKHQDLGDPYA